MTVRKGFAFEPQIWRDRGRWVKNLDLPWRRVSFIKSSALQVSNRGGVYAICLTSQRYVSDGAPWRHWATPMYIGRSTCLRTRFSSHVKGEYDATRELALSFRGLDFWFSIVEDLEIQQKLEANLISMFGPPMNRVQPSLHPIVGTIGDPVAFSFPIEFESTATSEGV